MSNPTPLEKALARRERDDRELEVLQAEDEFAKKKADGTVTREDKENLRALRQDFRENHRKPTESGAQAGVISVKAKPEETG